MMYDFGLAWRSVRARPIQTLIPLLVVALAIALSVTVLALSDGVRQGIVEASDPFGVLVVGPKGDGQQLVLNTVLLQGAPLGLIPYEIYERLANDDRAALVVPLAKGDNVGGAPLIGTTLDFFELRRAANQPPAFQLAAGTLFAGDFEAVLGSEAAAGLGLRIGDTFRASHGHGSAIESDVHEQVYTVVGVLQPSGTPYDAAVFTTMNSIWEAHHQEEEGEEGVTGALTIETAATENALTAILVLPTGFVEQGQIWQEFFASTEAQAVFPGQQIGGIFDLINQGVRILQVVAYLVLGIAAMTVFLSVYSATLAREQSIAIMRSLGSRRLNVFRMIIFETLLLSVLGALLGRLFGYTAALVLGSIFTQSSAIAVPIRFMTELEPLLWLLPAGVGVLAGLLPALRAYRVDVVEKLFPA